MRIGSLCSGCEGLGLGLELALGADLGTALAWHAEKEDAPSAVLSHHWPDVPNLGDIKAIDWSAIEPVDWLTAGYPCQPFSLAGKRLGADDPRHLWPDVADAIRVLRPEHVLLENVAGHLSKGFSQVLADLAALGYVGSWVRLGASAVLAPHRRQRVFIVAADARGQAGHERAGLREAGPGGLGRGRPDDVGGQAAADPGRGGQQGLGRVEPLGRDADRRRDQDGAGHQGQPPAAADTGGPGRQGREAHHGPGPDTSVAGGGRGLGPGQRRGVPGLAAAAADAEGDRRHEGLAEPARIERGFDPAGDGVLAATDPVGGRWGGRSPDPWWGSIARAAAAGNRQVPWGPYEPAIRRWELTLGRDAPMPTQMGRKGHQLAPRFVEWMMGLPEGHVTGVPGLSRNEQLRILGNGVVPQQCAEAVDVLLDRLYGPVAR